MRDNRFSSSFHLGKYSWDKFNFCIKKSVYGCVSLMVIYSPKKKFKWPPENAEWGLTECCQNVHSF